MKRTISLAASLGLLFAIAAPASAAVESGPKCADIDTLLWEYDGTDAATSDTSDDVDRLDEFGIRLKAPSCERYTYTLYLYADAAGTDLLNTFVWAGDGTTQVFGPVYYNVEDPDGTVYIYGESSFTTKNGTRIVLDRAPDEGLQVVIEDGPTGGTGVKAG